MAVTSDILMQGIPSDARQTWLDLVSELGARSYGQAFTMLMLAWRDQRLILMPQHSWESFQEALAQAAARQAAAIARKETRKVLYEEGFIPHPK